MLSQPASLAGRHGPSNAGEFLAMCRIVRSSLPKERYRHVLGVARTAERLARRYGSSTHKARVAALVHDIARAWPTDNLLAYARQHGLTVSAAEESKPVLLHARIGANIACEHFGIDDVEVLNAIERHTVAVPGMSDLEKIIYIADAIEPSRPFSQRAILAAAADHSLDEGLLACVKSSMEYLTGCGVAIAPQTIALYQQLVRRSETTS